MPDTPSDIVAALYRAAAGSLPWAEALKRVGDSVGGAFTLIGIVDKVAQRTNSITSEPFDPERRERYRGRYFALNPRVAHSARQPVGKVFYEAAIAPDRELARHPYYAEYLAQRDFTHFISANLENGPTRRVNLSVQRTRRFGHVDKHDVKTIEAIIPHAIAAFELWETLQKVSMQTLMMLDAFEMLEAGVFVVDDGGALIFANEAGSALLAAEGPFTSASGVLGVTDARQRDGFAQMIAAAHSESTANVGSVGRMTLSAEDGRRFSVAARPMPEMIALEGASRTGILITAERLQPMSTADELQRLLGLTAGEAALALALADGAKPSDYARERGIGGETVRVQLAALRSKLATSEHGRAVSTVLRHAQRLQNGFTNPRFLAVRTGAPADAPWAEQYGLTPAEARLAAFLLDGGTTAGYAAERGLSLHTVRNQLRSIYAKTNTNRQVSLLQLLLRAPRKKH
ncbi:MAG: hypothetical protein GC190_04530 [Alphaproteobacteria bacterium]|nr:hypothetical protein [Alphaproteobacteria bacterium]